MEHANMQVQPVTDYRHTLKYSEVDMEKIDFLFWYGSGHEAICSIMFQQYPSTVFLSLLIVWTGKYYIQGA